jgi:hypothetical protein
MLVFTDLSRSPELAWVAERLSIIDGQPFLIGEDGVFDREVNAFLRSLVDPSSLGRNTWRTYAYQAFSQDELDVTAEQYIHCLANWNAIVVNTDGLIHGSASPSELIGFINRPDEQWKRSFYSMDGKKV